MEEERIIKSGHFYLKPLLDVEPIEVEDATYYYFQVLDMKKEVVTAYDYLHIKGSVRLDYEVNMFRLYPNFGELNLIYDIDNHTIYSEELEDGEEKE